MPGFIIIDARVHVIDSGACFPSTRLCRGQKSCMRSACPESKTSKARVTKVGVFLTLSIVLTKLRIRSKPLFHRKIGYFAISRQGRSMRKDYSKPRLMFSSCFIFFFSLLKTNCKKLQRVTSSDIIGCCAFQQKLGLCCIFDNCCIDHKLKTYHNMERFILTVIKH